jgi:hypothetical protein
MTAQRAAAQLHVRRNVRPAVRIVLTLVATALLLVLWFVLVLLFDLWAVVGWLAVALAAYVVLRLWRADLRRDHRHW